MERGGWANFAKLNSGNKHRARPGEVKTQEIGHCFTFAGLHVLLLINCTEPPCGFQVSTECTFIITVARFIVHDAFEMTRRLTHLWTPGLLVCRGISPVLIPRRPRKSFLEQVVMWAISLITTIVSCDEGGVKISEGSLWTQVLRTYHCTMIIGASECVLSCAYTVCA